MRLRVMLLDDNALYRQALRLLLDVQPTSQVVAELSDTDNVLELIRQTRPQLICMDIEMPRAQGPDIARHVLQHHPAVLIVALSAHTDARYVSAMFKAGARGYVVKGQPASELLHALRVVSEGQVYIDPSLGLDQLEAGLG